MAGRGRPEFKVTQPMRAKVERLVMAGMTHETIARAIDCDRATLTKHFAAELQCGLAKKRAEVIDMLFASAKAGNVSAQKKLEEMSRVTLAEETFTQPERQPALGKKERAHIAAQTAGQDSEWGSDLKSTIN
jgi:hypothetical protein